MIKLLRLARIALLVGVLSTRIAAGADNPNAIIALKAARMFDGKAKALVTNGVVIV